METIEKGSGDLLVNKRFQSILDSNGIDSAVKLWNLAGEPVKKKLAQRGTERIVLKDNGKDYECYLKRYRPRPIAEKVKNFLSLKFTSGEDALNEWRAFKNFAGKGISVPEPIAYGSIGNCNCILLSGLKDYIRASDFLASPEIDPSRRRKVLNQIARLAALMHSANFAHQDFYLVHFFVILSDLDKVYIIDLQRAIMPRSGQINERWIVKDLGQLLFSAEKICTKREILRFWGIYCKMRKISSRNGVLITKIRGKAEKIGKREIKKQ